jgi:hypothetical protein
MEILIQMCLYAFCTFEEKLICYTKFTKTQTGAATRQVHLVHSTYTPKSAQHNPVSQLSFFSNRQIMIKFY